MSAIGIRQSVFVSKLGGDLDKLQAHSSPKLYSGHSHHQWCGRLSVRNSGTAGSRYCRLCGNLCSVRLQSRYLPQGHRRGENVCHQGYSHFNVRLFVLPAAWSESRHIISCSARRRLGREFILNLARRPQDPIPRPTFSVDLLTSVTTSGLFPWFFPDACLDQTRPLPS